MTKSTFRSIEGDGRKSPYYLPGIIPPEKQKTNIKECDAKPKPIENKSIRHSELVNKPRTLVHSSVGRKPDTNLQDKASTKSENNNKRPKSVHYEDENQPKEATLLGDYMVKAPNDRQPCKIVACVYLPNDTLIMSDSANKNIKQFDQNCQFQSSMPMEQLPIAICASPDNVTELYASSGCRVYRVGTSGGMHEKSSFDTNISRIEGITPWKSGIAAIFRSVRSRSDKKGHWEVHLMSYDGTVKYEIAISTHLVVKLVTPIWYISSSSSGDEIFISDTHNNRILCVDVLNWHVVYVIKGKEASGAPRSLATDASGNVLVAWYDGVHSISQAGTDLGTPVPNIGKGSVIAFNPRTQRLAVWSDKKTESCKFGVYQLK